MAKGAFRFRDAAGMAARKFVAWVSEDSKDVASSPCWTAGSAAPTTTDFPKGSFYSRTGGSSNNELLYVYNGSAWVALSAVS